VQLAKWFPSSVRLTVYALDANAHLPKAPTVNFVASVRRTYYAYLVAQLNGYGYISWGDNMEKNAANRQERLLSTKDRVCLTLEESHNFDKCMLGALSALCPDFYWDGAMKAAQLGVELMRANGGKVPDNNLLIASLIKERS
jgi:hypothetical protein